MFLQIPSSFVTFSSNTTPGSDEFARRGREATYCQQRLFRSRDHTASKSISLPIIHLSSNFHRPSVLCNMWSMLILCITLCSPPLLTYTVKVKLSFGMDYESLNAVGSVFSAETCRDLRPGMCCQAWPRPNPATSWRSGTRLVRPHYPVAEWTGLESIDIAAVWKPHYGTGTSQSDGKGCGGIVVATKPGPGNWRYEVDNYRVEEVSGASYLRVPLG